MEVATTNNHHHHNHHNPHLHSHHQLVHPAHRIPMAMARQQQPNLHLSVISATADATDAGGNGAIGDGSPRSPFQREVREWQRIDPDTGALLSGRLEADRWINGPLNSYGKISDSQNISQPNGTQHTQRKQLEVLQTRTANGAVKVIRAQTVQTSSSRSWSSSNSNSASTSASASASASPICMASNSVGGGGGVGRSILHNHNNHHHNHHNNNNSGMSNNNHFHSTLQQHLAEANTHWLQLSPPTIATTVDISEVSTDDDLEKAAAATASATTAMAETTTPYIVDDGETDDGAGAGAGDDGVPCNYSICRSGSGGSGGSGGSSGGSKGQAISNAIVLPLSSSSSTSTLHSQSSSVRLLPDTAPSLKLSNLMKSSSGGSNSSSNNSTNTTNTTTANTHKSAVGKVSLHAIVGSGGGDNNNSNKSRQATSNVAIKSPKSTATATQSSNGTVTGTKTWQQQRSARHLEQATLYGQNSNSTKSRVGVADCDDCSAAGAEAEALTALPDDADESRRRYHHHHHQQPLRNLHQTNQQPQQQNQQIELLERATPTRRRDLESFRHYAGSAATAQLASETMSSSSMDDNAKDDDLRLTTRQLRRQQQPFGQSASSNNALLQRSHSISTDDLSNEWESHEAIAESNEWRRVSKLRRSFQSSSSGNNSSSTSIDQQAQSASSTPRRLFDLPASSVSVSRIRAELESGRRLTTAMRNNHVDLAALESILHGPKDATTTAPNSKHNALLTAESLKEIRGRLKKLSDESLYKDDFIAYQQPPEADEHIEVQQSVRRKLSTPRLPQLTPEESPEISTPPHLQQHQSAFRAVGTQRISPDSEPLAQRDSPTNPKHNSHSLESRQKVKDTNSTEWHSRRKSYGFEQMSPPENKSIFRMDASTDSGLGRSGELSNWSPTESAAAASTAAAAAARATVIHFGEPAKTVTQAHFRAGKSPARHTPDEDLHKRHSIAVDESQYVRDNLRKTSQVHLNGFYDTAELGSKPNMQLSRYDSNPEGSQGCNSTLFQRAQNAQKRVEFCKTEVHFAAESGRVNIVETDGKPPPTNNFRRRRRTTSGPLQSLTNSSASTAVTTTTAATASGNVTHFGDDRQRHRTIASSLVAYKATLMEPPDVVEAPVLLPATTGVTVSVQKLTACSDSYAEGTHASYASTTSGIDTTDNENDEIAGIRGILKNKPVKPKPYHLGENIDSADALWGVQLKPVAGGGGSSAISDGRDKDDSPTAVLNKSVAERVRIAEKRREHSTQNGYSTKINLSLDEAAATGTRDWPSTDLPKSNIMSIELHSPHISLEKRDSFKRMQSPPRAKPRTTTSAVNSTEHRQIHIATTVKQPIDRCMPTEEQRAALKIIKEARGARKLREHELSYFGVANAHKGHEAHETKTKLLPSSNTNAMSASTRRTLPSRQRLSLSGNEVESKPMRRHEANNAETTTAAAATAAAAAIETTTETKATKWQLLNDKPDLLRHSPIAVEPQLIRRTADIQSRIRTSSAERGKRMSLQELSLEDEHVDEDDYDHDNNDHYYENITNELTPVFKVKSPQPYDRKMDVERDAFILSEMNENADLTMKALSDEAAHKDRRRRRSSLHRRDSKPLETIDEKMVTHKNNDTCIAVKISRGTFASEAKRNTRQSSPTVHDTHTRVRTSSQSSVESCPRARSRSLSSEREYENIRTPKPTRSATTTSTKTQAKVTGKQQHRSSSRESQRSARLQYSSGDEVNARDEQRVRVKSKRSGVSSANALSSRSGDRRSKKDSTIDHKQQQHHSSNSRDGERRRAASSTTHASQREERAECVTVPQQQQRTTSSGRSSSSKRREEHVTSSHAGVGVGHSSSRSATEKSRSVNAGVRLLRTLRRRTDADCGVHSTQHRLSGHRPNSERERSEREHERERVHEKERERDKQSKTRGHSTSKTPHHSKNSEPQRISGTTTHQLPALSSSMTRSKSRERKKSSVTKQHESAATPTHSKSSQIISGRHSSGQRDGQPNKQSDHSRRQQERSTSEQKKRSEHSASARK